MNSPLPPTGRLTAHWKYEHIIASTPPEPSSWSGSIDHAARLASTALTSSRSKYSSITCSGELMNTRAAPRRLLRPLAARHRTWPIVLKVGRVG